MGEKPLIKDISLPSRQRVFLIHGVFMRSPIMWLLGRRIKSFGFETEYFDYPSTNGTPEKHAQVLAEKLSSYSDSSALIVAHSLGGLIALKAIAQVPQLTGRLVLLGSPVKGSLVGRKVGAWPVGKLIFGGALSAWAETERVVAPLGWECGVISGIRGLGVGRFLGIEFGGENDGTVSVSETQLSGAKDEICLPASHTGLVFSKDVAERTAFFLQHGLFNFPSSLLQF